jgi:hypothetical protein
MVYVAPAWKGTTKPKLLSRVTVILDGVLGWRLDLLATHKSRLQITITIPVISTLYKSLGHTLSLFTLLSLVVSR